MIDTKVEINKMCWKGKKEKMSDPPKMSGKTSQKNDI